MGSRLPILGSYVNLGGMGIAGEAATALEGIERFERRKWAARR